MVPLGTVMVPSGFSVNPAGTLTGVKVTEPDVTGTPLMVSFANTEGVAVPGVVDNVSVTASIVGCTTNVEVAVSQTVGFDT